VFAARLLLSSAVVRSLRRSDPSGFKLVFVFGARCFWAMECLRLGNCSRTYNLLGELGCRALLADPHRLTRHGDSDEVCRIFQTIVDGVSG